MTPTAAIIDFARREHRLPASVREAAVRLLADTLLVGAAGSTAPGADGVFDAARSWGVGEQARLLGRAERLPAASAAAVNAFQIHCLEWDAVHEPAVVHAMSVTAASLLAAIDRQGGCAPEDALTSLAVGVDIACGLGLAATSPLRFFRPATAGLMGAALAVARLEGVEPLEDVLGLAYSQCAGTMQAHSEGSIALPLQIALAARAAVTAVDLVKAGLSGPHDPLEGPYGYFALFDEGDPAAYSSQLGQVWRIAEMSIKPYPSGRASHGMLSAIEALLRAGEIRPEHVARIDCFLPPLASRLVGRSFRAEMTPAYARLCLPFLSALMLTEGRIDPRRFTPATMRSSNIRDLAARVHIHSDGNPDPNALSPQRLAVTDTNGRIVELDVPITLGHPERLMDPAQLNAKRSLAIELAGRPVDSALFEGPLGYTAGAGSLATHIEGE